MASEKVGHGPCPQKSCAAEAFFSRSAGGKLKYQCTHCDSSGYCDPGGAAYRANMAGMKQAAPAPTEALPAVTKPAPKKSSELLLA